MKKLPRGRDGLFEEFMIPFSQMFDDFWAQSPEFKKFYGPNFFEKGSYPKIDLRDTSEALIIEAAVPGMSKDDIAIELDNDILSIVGQKQESSNDYIYRELKRSAFRRSWKLHSKLDQSKISAKFENGMLILTIPKIQPEKVNSEIRKIEISE